MHHICALTDMAVLTISGKDAGQFLQGQSTCDLLALTERQTTLGAFCNPKGRVIAVFRTFHAASVFYVLLPQSLAESLAKRLSMYILRADVHMEQATSQWRCFGLKDTDTPDLGVFGDIVPPDAIDGIVVIPSGFLIRLPAASGTRHLLLTKVKGADSICKEAVTAGYQPIDRNDWALADIRCGIPQVVPATTEEFVPQMLNLDRLDGISFTKGCYTGQEIVARTHYLGTLKRAMFRLSCPLDAAPHPGQEIFLQGQAEQPIGQVLMAARNDRKLELLAVLNTVQAQAETILLGSAEGPALRLESLPYS